MKNRIVIIGRSHKEASDYSRGPRFQDCLDSPTLVSAAAHRLTILGSTGGMHIGTIYVTPHAPEGENWDVIADVIKRAKLINPEVQVVEEPRTVTA